jgi:hypothetical protein
MSDELIQWLSIAVITALVIVYVCLVEAYEEERTRVLEETLRADADRRWACSVLDEATHESARYDR